MMTAIQQHITQPSMFVSHGAPSLILDDCPARDFLKALASKLEKPDAILVVSAHWETDIPILSTAAKPEMIYDFSGFSPSLHQFTYPVKGAVEIAADIGELLSKQGFPVKYQMRGIDHGVWVPLCLIYPDADIPVVQLSIQPDLGAQHHANLGKALRSLRQKNILVLATGSITHNLSRFRMHQLHDAPEIEAVTFADWVNEKLQKSQLEELISFEDKAPFSKWNHPTPEHFYPLLVAAFAASDHPSSERMHHSYSYGVLAMDSYVFH